jgi:predicted component of type VI protein secretion system
MKKTEMQIPGTAGSVLGSDSSAGEHVRTADGQMRISLRMFESTQEMERKKNVQLVSARYMP